MTTKGETKVTVGSISLMRRGMFKTTWGDFDREDGGACEHEDELEPLDHELDSGQMSMYTGVRVLGS